MSGQAAGIANLGELDDPTASAGRSLPRPIRRAGLPGTDGDRPRGSHQAWAPIRGDGGGLESHSA
jgi:hypothetical protein